MYVYGVFTIGFTGIRVRGAKPNEARRAVGYSHTLNEIGFGVRGA